MMSEKVPTIVDNTGEATVRQVLARILSETACLDIATGYFEVSSLLALGEAWTNVEHIHILRVRDDGGGARGGGGVGEKEIGEGLERVIDWS